MKEPEEECLKSPRGSALIYGIIDSGIIERKGPDVPLGERKYDLALNIRTVGLREWRDSNKHYNRYEATPYKALEKLFSKYKLSEADQVVDFGSGRGRVAFYIHNRFQIPVIGVEANEQTLDEAFQNKYSYRRTASHIPAPIRFEFGLAEQYEVQPTHNCFYFFNPFSVHIFKRVVRNIISSFEKNPRIIDLILYYPIAEYKQFLHNHTRFRLINKVRLSGVQDPREKFVIYRLDDF